MPAWRGLGPSPHRERQEGHTALVAAIMSLTLTRDGRQADDAGGLPGTAESGLVPSREWRMAAGGSVSSE